VNAHQRAFALELLVGHGGSLESVGEADSGG
jgi:hypothetical protein